MSFVSGISDKETSFTITTHGVNVIKLSFSSLKSVTMFDPESFVEDKNSGSVRHFSVMKN